MNTTMTHARRDTRPRTAALVAGISLLAMAILAGFANFGVISPMVDADNPATTAATLVDSAGVVRLAAAAMVVVAILDVVVAWALYIVFRSVNPSLSMLGAWLRLVYAAILAVAINSLLSALRVAPIAIVQAQWFLDTFDDGWQIGLVFFGMSLLVVGTLAWQSHFIHRAFGALLIVSGLGYVIDALGTILSPNYIFPISTITFIGEVAFIFWLLIRGRKLPDSPTATQEAAA